MSERLLDVQQVAVEFAVSRGWLRRAARLQAVADVSLSLARGESLGLVGESGCGKSTLARTIVALQAPTRGRVLFLGSTLADRDTGALRAARRDLQIVFQDPLASLDPRMTVGEILAEPLRVHRRDLDAAARADLVARMLARVGLPMDARTRYPHAFSGGQCQRIGIARAMILEPALLVCDEPVSALDVSIQAEILALVETLRTVSGTAVLFVSHNLAVVRRVCDRVLVLYLGRMMEHGPAEHLFAAPRHPYTRALLDAVPVPDPAVQRTRLAAVTTGEIASPLDPPSGCVFRTRCRHAVDACAAARPALEARPGGGEVACLRWREVFGER
jgi:oligopeptide transport system ATP-binding protein